MPKLKKLPYLALYTGDLLKDPAVRMCSYAARGLWLDMLCLMHESARRGYLQLANGNPVNAELLARMTGGSTDEVSTLLQELENCGVYSRTEHGVIYNRRIVRDEHKRAACSEAGKKGGGNPTFGGHCKGEDKGGPKGQDKGSPNPKSVSSSIQLSHTPVSPEVVDDILEESLGGDELDRRIRAWIQNHRMLPNPAPVHVGNCRAMVEKVGWNGMVEAVEKAIAAEKDDAISYGAGIVRNQKRRAEVPAIVASEPTPTGRRKFAS